MNYINILTSEYPFTEAQVRAASPNTSFGAVFVAPYPFRPVVSVNPPMYNPLTHLLRELTPAEGPSGDFLQQWQIVELSAEVKAVKLEEARAQAWEAVKVLRDQKVNNGGYKVGTDWFHSDVLSRTQQLGLMVMGANIPAGLKWRTMDGAFVNMTQQLAADIFAAAAASDQALYEFADSLKDSIDAATDPRDININAGWPAVYGE